MKIQVPGKTFLVGEYAVLLGAPALGLATKPCFEVTYGSPSPMVFHPESPAGLYLKKNPGFGISMTDPYTGGFGRSTAEYLAAISPRLLKVKDKIPFAKILAEYKTYSSGSGIDLAFQYFGQVCLADQAVQFYQTFGWHFENLDFFIVSTALKIPTHEHLKSLDLKKLTELPALADKITHLYARNNESEFLYLMKLWSQTLKALGLTHPHSQELVELIGACEAVQLTKPCGALGADVLLVFFDRQQKAIVKDYLQNNKIKIEADSAALTEGAGPQLHRYRSQDVG